MSGEPKTLPLTEFIEMLARRGDGLYLTKDEHGWTVGLIDKADAALMGHAAEWEDIATDMLGVRVVARGEAAELRAENEELRRIAKHALSALGTWVSFGQREAAREEIERDLRRLAGGESER